ncbi:MAG: hypothetical protein WC869_10440 [Phycisphaerae bacterium]|jgi:hypothetical protein
MRRLTWTQRAVWLALVLALAGSLRHVAWSFASIEHGNLIAGYIQAAGVDLGLLALALGIQERRRMRLDARPLWAGVALFSVISIYANFVFGWVHADAVDAPLSAARPVVLSAVLPVLVLFLSEIAGQDAQRAIAASERDARKAERMLDDAEQPRIVVQAQAALPAPSPLACPICGATCGKDGKPFSKPEQVNAHQARGHPKEGA